MNYKNNFLYGKIPNNWEATTIGSLVKRKFIYPPKDGNHGNIHPKNSDFVTSGIPFIMASDLKGGKVNLKSCKFIKKEQADNLQKGFSQKGDVLLSHKATLGRTAIVQAGYEYIMLTPQVTYYRVKNKKLLSNYYLKYFFDNYKFQKVLSLYGGGGSTRDYIGITQQQELPIVVPPIEEQQFIVEPVQALDAKINLLRKQNQTLENIAQTLFKHWFIDIEFPDKDGKPYKSSGGKMVDSELGEIPEGWMVEDFEKTIEFIVDNRGKTPPISIAGQKLLEGFNIVNGQCFPSFDNEEKQKHVSVETFGNWFRDGHPKHLDILCATVGTLPKWCFTPKNSNLCIAQNIVAFRIDNKISSPYYIKLLFDSHYFRHEFNGRLITAVQPSIKIGHMTSIPIIIPAINVIKTFEKIVSGIFEKIENNYSEIQTLTKTRDTLLPKLMSGQIRLKNL
jgi:type I restriction enzyme, S subunit